MSRIDLGDCENILKEYYNINQNDSLIIIKFEKISNLSTERTLQYEVYDPINKTRLNLSICDNKLIDIYFSVELSEELQNLYDKLKDKGYDLFDINSAFYQDICTPFESEYGTDILLSDRINNYYYNNETVCQSNCFFSDYLMESKYLKCKCDKSNSEINTKAVTKFTPKSLYESFYDILRYSNYKVLFCYKLTFHINSITINKGSIIAIIYFIIYLIFFSLYYRKGITSFKLAIARIVIKRKKIIIEIKKDINPQKNEEKSNKNNDLLINSKSQKNLIKSQNVSNNTLNLIDKISDNVNSPPKKSSLVSSSTKIKNNRNKNKNVVIHLDKISEKQLIISRINPLEKISGIDFENNKNGNNNIIVFNDNDKIPNKDNLDNFELNKLKYEEALKLDKRTFLQIYWSLLRREHIIIFTFFVRNDFNLIFLKFTRFIFLICTDMAMNVFFFSDKTMHKMYLDYGKYDFYQQIPQIAYSVIVSQTMDIFLCYLILTDKHYYDIKDLDKSYRYKIFVIIKCIKRKILFFFIFIFIMLAFYWYAIACFCAVYVNTQNAFIKDSISSFILSLLYPFILYIFPALFRIISLKVVKVNLSWLYKISEIIPLF